MPSSTGPQASLNTAFVDLHDLLADDLDGIRGGFRTWYGHMDQPRVVMSSDYLLQVAGQVTSSLEVAAEHLRVFNEAWTAETHAYRTADQERRPLFEGHGEMETRRARRIAASVSGTFIACGSTLDAVAATTIGVLGLSRDLVTAGWPDLAAASDKRASMLASTPSTARQIQQQSLAVLDAAREQGPHGWLSWTLGMRHTLIHRARRFDMRRFYRVSRRQPLTYVMQLPKEPQLTDVEAMVLSQDATSVWLNEHAGDTMAGVHDQLVQLVDTVGLELSRVWRRRHTDPAVILQPLRQWRDLYPVRRDLTGFAGIGPALAPVRDGEEMRVSPLMGKRFTAARLLQRDGHPPEFWTRTLTAPQ